MRNRCYHCGNKPATRHSNFCEECLPENRPLYFPRAEVRLSPITKLLMLVALCTTIWCVFKAIECAFQ